MFLALATLAPLVFVRPLRLALRRALRPLHPQPLVPVRVLQLAVARPRISASSRGSTGSSAGFATDTWQKKVWSLAVTLIALVVAWLGVALGARRVAERADRSRLAHAGADGRRAAARPRSDAARRPCRPRRWGLVALVALACVFGLVVLRGETSRRDEPQRQRLPPADGALGGRPDRRGPRAARRLVPVPLARLVVLPPLPEPSAHAHRVRRARRPGRRPTTARTSGSCTSSSRSGRSRLPRRAPARVGALDGGRRRSRLAARSSARPATATSTAATPGRATASTRSSGRCGCCRSRGD